MLGARHAQNRCGDGSAHGRDGRSAHDLRHVQGLDSRYRDSRSGIAREDRRQARLQPRGGDAMIEVTARYFAAFRERAGRDRERITTSARTAAELYGELASKYGFADSMTRCKVAINDELADWNVTLEAGN